MAAALIPTSKALICEKCQVMPSRLTCSRCKCGHYCSKDCQSLDWIQHKEFCKLWGKPGTFINPFFTEKINNCIEKIPMKTPVDTAYISFSRYEHGEAALMIAVVNGDIQQIAHLLESNACVLVYDMFLNDALYYACNYPGIKTIEVRNEIVRMLLDAGIDPHSQGGISGKRAYEVAKDESTVALIKGHKYFDIFSKLRASVNESTPDKAIDTLVKQFVYMNWINKSIHWTFFQNRETMLNIKPHPKIIRKLAECEGDVADADIIENMFMDLQLRHNKFVKKMNEYIMETY